MKNCFPSEAVLKQNIDSNFKSLERTATHLSAILMLIYYYYYHLLVNDKMCKLIKTQLNENIHGFSL